MFSSEKLSPADAAILETFVVPRYLSLYGRVALDMLLAGEGARVLHVGCRTGYPDREIYQNVDGAEILGVDSSLPALELGRHKAAMLGDVQIEYRIQESLPGDLEPGIFTHALCLHPIVMDAERADLLSAIRWLLCPGGQALIGLPLRGSFQEICDLLREYALKNDEVEFGNALDQALSDRPSIETLSDQLEVAGFNDVDVEVRQTTLLYESGRAFVEDPVSRLMILPEIRSWLGLQDIRRPLDYVRDAIDKYWSEGKLELSINVGCASARCP